MSISSFQKAFHENEIVSDHSLLPIDARKPLLLAALKQSIHSLYPHNARTGIFLCVIHAFLEGFAGTDSATQYTRDLLFLLANVSIVVCGADHGRSCNICVKVRSRYSVSCFFLAPRNCSSLQAKAKIGRITADLQQSSLPDSLLGISTERSSLNQKPKPVAEIEACVNPSELQDQPPAFAVPLVQTVPEVREEAIPDPATDAELRQNPAKRARLNIEGTHPMLHTDVQN